MHTTPRRAVTLIELLVVTGVIGVLLGLLLSAVQNVRAAAARTACSNNMKQIGLALHHYHDTHGRLPDGFLKSSPLQTWVSVTWMAALLPQMDQSPLWAATERALAILPLDPLRNPPHIGLGTVVKPYVCPADGRLSAPVVTRDGLTVAFTSYLGVGGGGSGPRWRSDGVMGIYPGVRLTDISDGTSQTLAVGERPPPDTFQAGPWYPRLSANGYWGRLYGPDEDMPVLNYPIIGDPCGGPFAFGPGRVNNPCDRYHFWSLHPGGANFLFADGSVHFMPHAARNILPALATRAGGEIVELP